jgi:hypothetical protein
MWDTAAAAIAGFESQTLFSKRYCAFLRAMRLLIIFVVPSLMNAPGYDTV